MLLFDWSLFVNITYKDYNTYSPPLTELPTDTQCIPSNWVITELLLTSRFTVMSLKISLFVFIVAINKERSVRINIYSPGRG